MKPITLREIEAAVEGRLSNPEKYDLTITGVSIDSREDMEGKLFIPFYGKNFDAHAFIDDAFEKGAVVSLCEKEVLKCRSGKPVIYVKSTKDAIMKLAKYYRSLFKLPVIGITGSTGKTTTKDLIASVLSQKYRVVKTMGNYNNEIGLPLTIFNITEETEAAVLEMGMSHFNEIHNLSEIACPHIAVITNIGVSHMQNLGNKQGILKAKCEIFDFLDEDGYGVINGDDPMLITLHGHYKNLKFFGTKTDNDFYSSDVKYKGIKGISFRINKRSGDGIYVNSPTPGYHMVLNSLCAAAVGTIHDMSLEEIKKGIESYHPSTMRMDIFRNSRGANVINDVYNANPDSMKAALDVLKHAQGRKMCILGDMLELGDFSDEMHYTIGEYAATLNIDYIFTFGDKAKHIHEGALSKIQVGASRSSAVYFSDKNEIPQFALDILKDDDTVLLKASRGMKFEEITKSLA